MGVFSPVNYPWEFIKDKIYVVEFSPGQFKTEEFCWAYSPSIVMFPAIQANINKNFFRNEL